MSLLVAPLGVLAAVVGSCGSPDLKFPEEEDAGDAARDAVADSTPRAETGGTDEYSLECATDADCARFPSTRGCAQDLDPSRCVECLPGSDSCGPRSFCGPE